MSKENCILRERNVGIDLLKILAMYMIVMWHILGHGGIINSAEAFSLNYKIVWLIKICASCAVNVYAIISGYVTLGRKYSINDLIKLWGKVVFYTISITLVLFTIGIVPFGIKTLLKSFLPILTNAYWYFTAYVVLFLFIPILNKAVLECEKKELRNGMVLLFVLFSVITTFFERDLFHLNRGYSAVWLIYLYLIGAYIKKYEDDFKYISNFKCVVGIVLMVAIMWVVKCIPQTCEIQSIIEYVSPTVFIMSIFYVLLFKNFSVNDKNNKIIKTISNATFSIYLIHDNNLIRKFLIKDKFVEFSSLSSFELVMKIILLALVIYILCVAVELIRKYIAGRIINIF